MEMVCGEREVKCWAKIQSSQAEERAESSYSIGAVELPGAVLWIGPLSIGGGARLRVKQFILQRIEFR
jgi:hypothetical protein